MIIKPKIRSNVFTNCHPLGQEQFILNLIAEAKKQKPIGSKKNVLIIGGSSGYGLASRIALAFGMNANTINVSFESGPKGKRTGTAGYWNNIFFQKHTKNYPQTHKDFNGDAFSKAMKNDVIDYIKTHFGKLDLIIYSLASGARKDETTGGLVRSAIKTIGTPAKGHTIELAKEEVTPLNVEAASSEEIKNTVFVMGGSDWQTWLENLSQNDCLNDGVKTISYTYIGGETTDAIYRNGTIGQAKEDLEKTAGKLNQLLKEKHHGEALISSSKAVVTKASVFIPQMPIYVACLFDVMMEKGIHESILAHKYRLFKDMVYGTKAIKDDDGFLRVDHREMQSDVQHTTKTLMEAYTNDKIFTLKGTKAMLDDFYHMNGFGFSNIDYDQPVDMDALQQLKLN